MLIHIVRVQQAVENVDVEIEFVDVARDNRHRGRVAVAIFQTVQR